MIAWLKAWRLEVRFWWLIVTLPISRKGEEG